MRGGLWLNVGSSNIPRGQPEYSRRANAISGAAIYRGTKNPEGYWNVRDMTRPTVFAVETNQYNGALINVSAPPADFLKRLK